MATALNNLIALRNAAHDALPSEVAEWLTTAIDAYLANGGATRLDSLLGLRGAGIRKPGTRQGEETRNAALSRAYLLLPAIDGESDTARFTRLSNAIRNFEANKLNRLLHPETQNILSEFDKALLHAFTSSPGNNFPRSVSGLRKALLNAPDIHSTREDA